MFCLIAVLAIFSFAKDHILAVGEFFGLIGEGTSLGEGGKSILKVIGIGYVSGISTEVCRDLGAGGVAAAVSIFARLEALIVVIPHLVETVRIGMELLR